MRGRIDLSSLTPEQQKNAQRMAQFMNGPDGQRVFTTVGLAERLLPSFLALEHAPSQAAQSALTAAIVMHNVGEEFMRKEFDKWCADADLADKEAEALSAAQAFEQPSGVVNADAAALADSPVEGHVVENETISREQAVADTAERVASGEPVKPVTE